MEMENKFTRVEHILYNMFIEDTGIDMLDSGNAYGRHFEKNQKLKIDDFVNREMITYNKDDDYHSVDTFKFLSNRLNVDDETDELNKLFNDFANREENNYKSWYMIKNNFFNELLGLEDWSNSLKNTYNFNETLNQDFIFGLFEYNNNDYVIIRIHNGCDVRGGYTKPYIFKLDDEYLIFPDDEEYLRDEHKDYNEGCLCVEVEE